jgi:hypothetical protein
MNVPSKSQDHICSLPYFEFFDLITPKESLLYTGNGFQNISLQNMVPFAFQETTEKDVKPTKNSSCLFLLKLTMKIG